MPVNGDENWHEALMEELSDKPSEGIADAILDFFNRGTKEQTMAQLAPADWTRTARQTYSYHLANGVISKDGNPVVELTVIGLRKAQKIELIPANLHRLFPDAPESTIRLHTKEEAKNAIKANQSQ